MKEFTIQKRFIKEDDVIKLSIFVKHALSKNQSKNRLLLFNSESGAFRYAMGQ